MRPLRIIAPLLVMASAAHAGEYQEWRCYYHDETVDVTAPCTLHDTTVDGHFTYIMYIDGRYVTIEYVEKNGPDMIWILNDKLGIGHEINREHVQGFTLDGSVRVDWQDRPESEVGDDR